MFCSGSGGSLQAGSCVITLGSSGAVCGTSWVQTQHTVPLPPHQRMLSLTLAYGPTSSASSISCLPYKVRNVVRGPQLVRAVTRDPKTIADNAANCIPGPAAQPVLESQGSDLVDPQIPDQRFRSAISPRSKLAANNTDDTEDLVAGGQLLPADRRASAPQTFAVDGSPPSWSKRRRGLSRASARHPPDALPRVIQDTGPFTHPKISPGLLEAATQAHPYDVGRGKSSDRQQQQQQPSPGRSPLSTRPLPLPRAPLNRQESDKALIVAMLRSPSWIQVQELLHSHQERHLKASRMAAVMINNRADAWPSQGSSPAPESQSLTQQHLQVQHPHEQQQQLSANPQEVDQQESMLQLPSKHCDSETRMSRPFVSETPPELLHPSPSPTSTSTHVPHTKSNLHPQQTSQKALQTEQPAFTPRHLATALHVTSLRVLEPRLLSHSERVDLAEFLQALGRGCVSLVAREPFPPVDLAMALRALAKLVGDDAASERCGSLEVSHSGASRVLRASAAGLYGSSRSSSTDDDSDTDGDAQFASWRRRWEAHEHDEDTAASEVHDSWSRRVASMQYSTEGASQRRVESSVGGGSDHSRLPHERTLHAPWLDIGWVNSLLGPSIEHCVQDFEARHVSGVLWAVATLGVRPRPELLSALCERAAECARETVAITIPDPVNTTITAATPSTTSTVATAAPAKITGNASSPVSSDSYRHGRHGSALHCSGNTTVMTSQGLSLTMWSLARLGFHPHPSCLEALLTASEVGMRAAVEAAKVPRSGEVPAAVRGRAAAVGGSSRGPGRGAAGMAPCCSLDLAQQAWSLASLGCHPGQAWLELLVTAFLTLGSVEKISGQSCSMTLWALARLACLSPQPPCPMLLPELSVNLTEDSADVQVIPAAAPADGKRATSGGDVPTANSSTSKANVTATAVDIANDEDEGGLEMLLIRAESSAGASTSGRAPTTSPRGASPAVHRTAAAATAFPAVEPEGELESWLTTGGDESSGALLSSPEGAGGPEAALSRGVVAIFRQQPGQVASLLGLLEGALDRMSAQHLATVLWALSTLDVRPHQTWLEAYLEAADRRLSTALSEKRPFGPQALAMMLGALARLRYRPPPTWMVHFIEVCRKEFPTFGPHAACVLAWSLVRLSYKPRGDWRRTFAATTQRLLPSMPPLGLCLLLWSLASWRSRPPQPWLETALDVSAEHLRAGGEAWMRGAAALEVGTMVADDGPLQPPQTATVALRPELLAVLLWSISHLLQRPPPMYWTSLASSTTLAAIQYSRAVPTASADAAGGSYSPDLRGRLAASALGPRTLAMLLQGWARLGRPPAKSFLSSAMSYIADTAAATVARGKHGEALRLRATPGAAMSNTPFGRSAHNDDVEPQHVGMVMWSCAVMGLEPMPGLVGRLISLHTELVLLQAQQRPLGQRGRPEADVANGKTSASGAATDLADMDGSADGIIDSGGGGGSHGRPLHEPGSESCQSPGGGDGILVEGLSALRKPAMWELVVARELLGRQPELGMLVWSLVRFGVGTPPQWLPAVLEAIGCTLELDAAAAVATAAAAVTPAAEAAAAVAYTGVSTVTRATVAGDSAAAGPPSLLALTGPGPRFEQQEYKSPLSSWDSLLSPPPSSSSASPSCLSEVPLPSSSVSLLTVKTLARACLVWDMHPGERWMTAATACLDCGVLSTKLRRAYGRANLEAEVRHLLEQLQEAEGSRGKEGRKASNGVASRRGQLAAAEASGGGALLTNAMAAMAAGSAAAWMQGLVW